MKIRRRRPPREFAVGSGEIVIRHTADIELEPDEQVTFVTASGTELDVTRKSWGYYATPSMNARLARHGLRAALVRNEEGRLYLMLVERGQEQDFASYLRRERQRAVCWLDSDAAVEAALTRLTGPNPVE